ncbi:S-adenosyl-L-methionine-dependent methyltransferase [Xylariaceae sp. FL0016]|nr:S-adenosyl-L-methionine-dependent methyltransferase [Xylariaceae sp. FL0016]
MPRLAPQLIWRAHATSPHLVALLPACRDLTSARNELRWIREHVLSRCAGSSLEQRSLGDRRSRWTRSREGVEDEIAALCRRRGRGEPLQYVLGSQPFGDLEIRCRPGVLIPRPETEAWCYEAVGRIGRVLEREDGAAERGLRVLDLCSGSGCISLLLYALLRQRLGDSGVQVTGLDIEPRAVKLARENLLLNTDRQGMQDARGSIRFENADVFCDGWIDSIAQEWTSSIDVLVSNPPYISSQGFERDTGRSVRNHEPRLALVPELSLPFFPGRSPEDVFYARLLEIADILRPRTAVFEVGDLKQAMRVAEMGQRGYQGWETIEIWRDWPDLTPASDEVDTTQVGQMEVPVKGSGHGRAVFFQRK